MLNLELHCVNYQRATKMEAVINDLVSRLMDVLFNCGFVRRSSFFKRTKAAATAVYCYDLVSNVNAS